VKLKLVSWLDNFKIISFDEIDSTNSYLKRNYLREENLTVIKANFQNLGRGQFERKWFSNKGENLLFSVLLKDIKIDYISKIKDSIINSLLIVLEDFKINAYFKIPNDLYVDGKKICGILIETLIRNKTCEYVVIGVGLNINQEIFDENFDATSMKILLKEKIEIDLVLKKILEKFLFYFNRFKENMEE